MMQRAVSVGSDEEIKTPDGAGIDSLAMLGEKAQIKSDRQGEETQEIGRPSNAFSIGRKQQRPDYLRHAASFSADGLKYNRPADEQTAINYDQARNITGTGQRASNAETQILHELSSFEQQRRSNGQLGRSADGTIEAIQVASPSDQGNVRERSSAHSKSNKRDRKRRGYCKTSNGRAGHRTINFDAAKSDAIDTQIDTTRPLRPNKSSKHGVRYNCQNSHQYGMVRNALQEYVPGDAHGSVLDGGAGAPERYLSARLRSAYAGANAGLRPFPNENIESMSGPKQSLLD